MQTPLERFHVKLEGSSVCFQSNNMCQPVGMVYLQIRDYRNSLPKKGGTAASVENSPIVQKVLLRMSMENVVKDISLISEGSWTYEDSLVSKLY